MEFKREKKNKFILNLAGMAFLLFVFSNVALASEINKENIIQLVNQSRNDSGIESLVENENLVRAAREKAEDMIKNNYFSHNSPTGITPWYWLDKNGYDYKYAGENLALGFSLAEDEHQAWMESPSHRKNILNPNYKEIGVAVEKGEIDKKFVTIAVQMFGSRIKSSINGEKVENNISDEKSDELLEKNKKDDQGIILKTEEGNSNNQSGNLTGNNQSGSKFSFYDIKNYLDNKSMKNYIKIASVASILLYLVFNLISIFIIIFSNLVCCMKMDKDVSKAVHGLIVLFLVGSIVL